MDAGLKLMTVSHWVTDAAGTGRSRQSEILPVRPALADQFDRGELTEEQFWSKAMFEHLSRKPAVKLGDIHWNAGADEALPVNVDGRWFLVQDESAGTMSASDPRALARPMNAVYVVYFADGSRNTGIAADPKHTPDEVRELVTAWIRANMM
jgi:hypothetical protein